jgi:hypothetical protein
MVLFHNAEAARYEAKLDKANRALRDYELRQAETFAQVCMWVYA